ncbi:MAG TPA: hypothetical protein VK509_20235, partial [Polyangiales bacterium]|nr:hypothetical protein [Polyangiales bacterium]
MRTRGVSWWLSLGLWMALAPAALAQDSVRVDSARTAAAKELATRKVAAQKIESLPQGAVKLDLRDRAAGAASPTTAVPAAPVMPGTAAPSAQPVAVPADAPSGPVRVTSGAPRTRVPRPSRDDDMLELPLALEGVSAQQSDKLRVISAPSGARIKEQVNAAPVLELPVNGRAIVSSEQGKKSAERDPIQVDRKTALPWLVVETERSGNTQAVRAARPFLTLAKAITWNAREQLHVAEFLFGLDPEGGVAGALQQPVEARFSVSCDDVAPALARVEKIGPGGYGSVRVKCSAAVKNQQPQQFLAVHVEQGSLRYPFEIPRRPGPLRLFASALSVPGFGFGSVALTAEQLEEDGSPLRAPSATDLQLNADRSALDVSAVRIAEGASTATVEVHPRGGGELALSLANGTLRSPPLRLQLTFPWLALAAMIGGGTLGGVLFLFGPRPKQKGGGSASIWRKHPALRRAAEGALVGLLVSAFVLIVPSFALIAGWARSTELGLFVIAALAGFIGSPLLALAGRALFPAWAKERAA